MKGRGCRRKSREKCENWGENVERDGREIEASFVEWQQPKEAQVAVDAETRGTGEAAKEASFECHQFPGVHSQHD